MISDNMKMSIVSVRAIFAQMTISVARPAVPLPEIRNQKGRIAVRICQKVITLTQAKENLR